MGQNLIDTIFNQHIETVSLLRSWNSNIERAGAAIKDSLSNGGTIFWAGNGGSAADSQHMSAEFVGRFVRERRALPSIALTTDSSILTAVGNDYGFDQVFARQVEALCYNKDVFVAISTSGNSANLVLAVEAAKKKGVTTIALLGRDGGKLGPLVDHPIIVESNVTARIQECHILIGHILCEMVDEHA